jgi:acyl carrier protein
VEDHRADARAVFALPATEAAARRVPDLWHVQRPPRHQRLTGAARAGNAMNGDEVFEVVRAAVARVLEIDPATVTRTTSFAADLHADSLALVEVVEIVEAQLRARASSNFVIDDDDIEDLETVGAAADYAVARL